jgi:hypothetical protein
VPIAENVCEKTQEGKDHDNRKCNIAKRQSTFCLANDDGKLPGGQISQSLSSPIDKNTPLNPSGKSSLQARPVPPEKGRIASRTNARWDAMDATASGAQGIAGRDFP